MTRHHLLFALTLLTLAPCARADDPITLTDDVLFVWKMRHDEHGKYGMCGFAILGNQSSHADPRVVYDINLDQIFNGADRVVGFNIGTFDVVHGVRNPRAPVTEFSFSYEGGAEPLAADIVGAPNASNAVQGTIALERSAPLFEAFAFEKWITMSVKYADGRTETLRTRGFHGGAYGGARMNPYARCLRGDTQPVGRQLGTRIKP